jgi:pilus assembly protein CpaE
MTEQKAQQIAARTGIDLEGGAQAAGPAGPAEGRRLPPFDVLAVARTEAVIAQLRSTQKHPACSRMSWRYQRGGLGQASLHYLETHAPDILLVEVEEDPDRVLAQLAELSQVLEARTRVILMNAEAPPDQRLLRDVFKLGVSEFLFPPFAETEVISALGAVAADIGEVRQGRLTAFLGVRGGVGSSTVAQTVAVAISMFSEAEVILADLDQQTGTVALNFDAVDARTLTDVLRRRSPIDDVLMERLFVPVNERLKLLLVEPSFENAPHLAAPALNAIISLADRRGRQLLFDMPSVWDSRTRKTLAQADHVVITAEPTLGCLLTAQKALESLRGVRGASRDVTLVLNKYRSQRGNAVPDRAFTEMLGLGADQVVRVPADAALFSHAQYSGKSAVQFKEGAAASQALIALAARVNGGLDYGAALPLGQRLAAKLRQWW